MMILSQFSSREENTICFRFCVEVLNWNFNFIREVITWNIRPPFHQINYTFILRCLFKKWKSQVQVAELYWKVYYLYDFARYFFQRLYRYFNFKTHQIRQSSWFDNGILADFPRFAGKHFQIVIRAWIEVEVNGLL